MFDPAQLQAMLGNIQEKAKELEEKTKTEIYEIKSGGGLISLKANGAGEIIDLNIDDTLLEDRESLQILLIGAFNEVFEAIEKGKKNSALSMLGGLNLFGQN